MTKRFLSAGIALSIGLATGIGWLPLVPCANAADSATTSLGQPSQTIDITVGAQQTLAVGHALARIAVGDPTVADVLIVKGDRRGGVLLIGKAAGTTDVMLWERGQEMPVRYTVNVTTNAAHALLGSDTPGVKVLSGTALITGSTPTMEQHQRAVVAANGSLGKDGTVFDTSTIATRPVVQVDVRVVEFSRQVLKEAGFNFLRQNNGFAFGSFGPSSLTTFTPALSPGQTMSVTATSPISSAFNLVFNSVTHGLAADLSLLESNNLARVLAEPTLVALSGQSASFLAGGEIPIPVPEALGTTSIEYKPYGIGLSLTPTVLSPQRIALKVAPEASQLDFVHAVTVNGISVPAITTRRADTTVELGDGESFVIGGLIDRETASNVDKVPLLGDLPVIGAFFKQLNYQQTDKELVIIVTPHLVSPLAKGATVPATPGEQAEQRNPPVWRSFLGGAASNDAAPGFSK
ncbi:type II and III secretion system protein family protein [Paraburkholderia phosphatilytica]|uniref:type II and III secretion system protein family protein n=1 Tax=Paraburkholderia phosphatilytica TaxID=2282883 RepID=UPI000E4EB8A0|nr:type II and III secretion system protein family protein [Paraburkholderia phosphatilytica]